MLTPERAAARVWFASWWPWRSKAEAVIGEWAEIAEKYPHAMADLARFCNAGDSSLDGAPIDPLRLAANEGRREVFLHVRTVARLDESDVSQLLERTEE